MNRYSIVFVILVFISTISCTKEPDANELSGEIITFKAYMAESCAKSTLKDGGTTIYWEPSDTISVSYSYATEYFISTNTEPSPITDFTCSNSWITYVIGEESESVVKLDFYAVYPHNNVKCYGEDGIFVTLPYEQAGKAGSFAKGMNIAMAKSNSYKLDFYNVCGGVRFKLVNEGIKKVTFAANGGESVAGRFETSFEGQIPIVEQVHEKKTGIVLTMPDGTAFESGKWYYICMLPGVLSKGFTMRFETDSQYATLSSDESVTIKRAVFGQLEDVDKGLVFRDNYLITTGAVDMGVSVKWAANNIGATRPEEYGEYYQWAGTKDVSTGVGDKAPYQVWDAFEKYNTREATLELKDDIANINLGGKWRIPTKQEFEELLEHCYWERTVYNDVDGLMVYSFKTGNRIFFPAAGLIRLGGGERSDLPRYSGHYWTSILRPEDYKHTSAYTLSFFERDVAVSYQSRSLGLSIRPVLPSVTDISLNVTELSLGIGEMATLTATVYPAIATDKTVVWSSADTSVATVDQSGLVTAIYPGKTTVSVKTNDGNKIATCTVTVVGGNLERPKDGGSWEWD